MGLITVPGSADKMDWASWGLPITNAVNDHDTRVGSLELRASFGVAILPPSPGGAGDSTVSGTYVNLAGTSTVSFTKVVTSSRLILRLSAAFFITASAGTTAMFGLLINGVDYDVASFGTGTLSANVLAVGYALVAGGVVSAGTYTVQGRWKRSGGAGTLNRDTATMISFEVEEK